MSKGTTIASVLIAFLAGSTLMCAVDKNADDKSGSAETAAASHAKAKVPVAAANPTWGNADAPVTIVEFSDFQCPWCSKVGPTLDELKKHYGPEKLRVVWKHFPLSFHKKAGPAHEASAVAYELGGNEAFWKFHDLAFENQKNLEPANFGEWATKSGLDKAQFEAALTAKKGAAIVAADQADAKGIGVSGTPSIFVNGIKPQRRDTESMKKLIDEQIAAAKALTDAGTPPSEVYVKLSETNFKAPAPRAERPARKSPAEDKDVFKIPVSKNDPQKGSDDAIITIVEYSDFQCPFCKRVNGTIDQVQKEYGDQVRIVWKDQPLPFHGQAKPAAALAQYAYETKGDKGFWAVHDAIFENQKELKAGEPTLEKIAKEAGLNWAKAKKAIDSGKYNESIEASQKVAAQFGARGTPHFFINGRRVPGAQPFPVFKAVIDQEIIKANALVEAGTPKGEVYAKAVANGKTKVEAPPAAQAKPQGLEKKDIGAPPATSPFKGGENATIIIQEFSDFQCPFCSRVNPTLKQVQKEYGDEVKIVWRNLPLPFHKDAPLAAEAALEAHTQKGNDGFWAFHDLLFENQRALKREQLEEYAAKLGLDMGAFKAALDNRTHKASVEADVKAANAAGIRGTPGFVVNGYFVSGAQPFPAFKTAIDKAKEDAKKK